MERRSRTPSPMGRHKRLLSNSLWKGTSLKLIGCYKELRGSDRHLYASLREPSCDRETSVEVKARLFCSLLNVA